jgi:polyketide synthase PksM/rhizoxin synthesis polyketide synthase/nonribosomal peptide synthetase RhiB
MSGRFPGAGTIAEFEALVVEGRDALGAPPRERWDHAAIYDPTPGAPGKTVCPAGGFLDRVDLFDPLFFDLSPAEAAAMDPQQRLFLEEAWRALEDAGYGGPHPGRRRCGVFVGCAAGDYQSLLRRRGRLPDAQSFMGASASMLAGRVAYRLDLAGPSLSIDTACSSSLVAVQLACESLMRRETDMALAGGVAVMTTPDFYIAGSGAGMLSPSGRCRTLDESADGFVPGEAVAAIVLKRRADAERDGDRIVALIKGAAVNQDGAGNGVTAPNGKAQTALLRLAQERFAIAPETIGYVELHGAGTRLGDPIEIEALTAAFGAAAAGCAIGSAKANIGHCLAAAGIAGLIKLAVLLRRGVVPPALHFARANPHIGADCGGFLVPREARRWPERGGPRRGAVSSFGFSGTNAHVLLEEAPEPARSVAPREGWGLAVVSARSEAALARQLERLASWLREDGGRTPFVDICATLAHGRAHFDHRAAVLARDAAGLAAQLAGVAIDDPAAPLALREARARYLAGGAPDRDALFPPGRFRRVALPTYAFERRRCWPQEAPPAEAPALGLLDAVLQDLGAAE